MVANIVIISKIMRIVKNFVEMVLILDGKLYINIRKNTACGAAKNKTHLIQNNTSSGACVDTEK